MKDGIALQSLQKIAANYEQQAKDIRNLRRKVRELTAQRDQANARNAELRGHLAKYQKALADERAKGRETQASAWGVTRRVLEAA